MGEGELCVTRSDGGILVWFSVVEDRLGRRRRQRRRDLSLSLISSTSCATLPRIKEAKASAQQHRGTKRDGGKVEDLWESREEER